MNMIRKCSVCIFYLIALLAFLGGITAESTGSILDFSNLVRVLCCILAVICVLIATIIWKTKDVSGKRIKIGLMIVLFAIIMIGGIIDSKKIHHADAEYGYQFVEDVNTQYFFSGKVVAVYEECLILEVFDIGNSNLYEGCQVEVSTDVVSVQGCPNFVVNEFARVLMARNTEENPAKRLHALAIYKTDETGSILYNNND